VASPEVLTTIGSITVGFGANLLLFRIGRELTMQTKQERAWLPWCDKLPPGSTLVSALLVLLPILLFHDSATLSERIPTGFSAAFLICLC
jgi:hypothetical protein